MQADELDPEGVKFAKSIDQLTQAASEAVVAVDNHGIDLAPAARGQHAVQLGPTLTCAAYASVDVLVDNLPAAAGAVLAQLGKLHLRVLAGVGADTGVQCSAN